MHVYTHILSWLCFHVSLNISPSSLIWFVMSSPNCFNLFWNSSWKAFRVACTLFMASTVCSRFSWISLKSKRVGYALNEIRQGLLTCMCWWSVAQAGVWTRFWHSSCLQSPGSYPSSSSWACPSFHFHVVSIQSLLSLLIAVSYTHLTLPTMLMV